MKPHLRAFLILWTAVLATVVQAHDPYEITGTGSVFSNRFEVTAVLEYRAARLLAGLGWPTNQINEAEEFSTMKPALEKVAANFFQVAAAGKNLRSDYVALALGVENHITFTIEFPAIGEQPVTVSAPGLAALAPEGQYGVGLTMLDMVRKKVLGQHVFSAANPLAQATFSPPTETVAAANLENDSPGAAIENGKTNRSSSPVLAEPEPAQKKPLLWPWFVAAAGGTLLAWRLSRSK